MWSSMHRDRPSRIETDPLDTPLKDSDPTHWNGWVFTMRAHTWQARCTQGIITGTPRIPKAGLPGEQQLGREIARVGRKLPASGWRKRGGRSTAILAILAQIFTEPQCQRMYSNACPYPNDTSTPEPAKHYRLIHSDRSQVRALLFFVFIATALRRMFD